MNFWPDFKWYHWPILVVAFIYAMIIGKPLHRIRQKLCKHNFKRFTGNHEVCTKCELLVDTERKRSE